MYTASVALTRAILLDPSNPTQQVVAGTGGLGPGSNSPRIVQGQLGGEFRKYAAGRTRLVLDGSSTRTVTVTFKGLTAAQSRLLTDVWPGRLLLLRDTYGVRMFGSYLAESLQYIPRSSQGAVADVSLEFGCLTYTDQV